MRVMDNGTGLASTMPSSEAEQPKPDFTILERKSQLHVSGSQLVKHFMGLLCNKLLGVEKKHTGLDEEIYGPSPNKQVEIKPMKASLLLFRNREEKTENTQSIPSKCDSLGV
jgi:hypothetical protein